MGDSMLDSADEFLRKMLRKMRRSAEASISAKELASVRVGYGTCSDEGIYVDRTLDEKT